MEHITIFTVEPTLSSGADTTYKNHLDCMYEQSASDGAFSFFWWRFNIVQITSQNVGSSLAS